MSITKAEVATLLKEVVSTSNDERSTAEKKISQFFEKSFDEAFNVFAEAGASLSVGAERQLVDVLLKSQFSKHAKKSHQSLSTLFKSDLSEIYKLVLPYPRVCAALLLHAEHNGPTDVPILKMLVEKCSSLKASDITPDAQATRDLSALLMCLSFFCADSKSGTLPEGNALLTLIINLSIGLFASSQTNILTLLADALSAVIPFISHNMAVQAECRMIMMTIGRMSTHENVTIRAKGIQALTKVAESFLNVLTPFMGAIFPQHIKILTAAENAEDTLAVLEFWTTVAESLEDENFSIITQAAGPLLPILCTLISRNSGDGSELDTEEFTQKQAANVLLQTILATTEKNFDKLAPLLYTSFISKHIHDSADWQKQEAACLILGTIFSANAGPVSKHIPNSIAEAVSKMLSSPVLLVQDTAAWTIFQWCRYPEDSHGEVVAQFLKLIVTFLSSKSLAPSVIGNLCAAVASICEWCEGDDCNPTALEAFRTHVQKIVEVGMVLLHKTPTQRNVITEMILALIRALPEDVPDLLPRMLSMYGSAAHSIVKESGPVESWPLGPSMAFISAIMQKPQIAAEPAKYTSSAINLAGSVIAYCQPKKENKNLRECISDALIIVGTVLSFAPDDTQWLPFVPLALSIIADDEEDSSTRYAALGLLSDITRRHDFAESIVVEPMLMAALKLCSSSDTPRTLKPPAVALLGDVALALGEKMGRYIQVSANLVGFALEAIPGLLRNEDDDAINFCVELLEAILDTISSFALSTKELIPNAVKFIQGILAISRTLFQFLEGQSSHVDTFAPTIKKIYFTYSDLHTHIPGAPATPKWFIDAARDYPNVPSSIIALLKKNAGDTLKDDDM